MQLKYSVPAFWIAILISLTVHLDPLFAQRLGDKWSEV
jgi:hypothetical protein